METYKVSDSISATIRRSRDYDERHGGNKMMCRLRNKTKNEAFMRLLNELAIFTNIDALGGSKALLITIMFLIPFGLGLWLGLSAHNVI